MKKYFQKLFINLLVKHLYNTVTERDLIQIRGRDKTGPIVIYRNERLDQDKVQRLRESAELFKNSDIWRMLRRAVQLSANERMYNKSKTTDDILAGKMALWNLEVIDKTIEKLSQLR